MFSDQVEFQAISLSLLNSTHSPFFNVGQLEVDLLWAIFASKFFSEAATESSSVSVRSPALLLLVH